MCTSVFAPVEIAETADSTMVLLGIMRLPSDMNLPFPLLRVGGFAYQETKKRKRTNHEQITFLLGKFST